MELTYQRSIVVIVAAENAIDVADTAALLRRGATAESAAGYLGRFGNALRERYGASLADVTVDGFNQIGDSFAAVIVTGQSEATVIARRNESGLWQVDLVGTLGPALITQIREMLDAASDDANGATIREAFATDVVPSLEAAAAHDPANLTLASELRLMKSELGL